MVGRAIVEMTLALRDRRIHPSREHEDHRSWEVISYFLDAIVDRLIFNDVVVVKDEQEYLIRFSDLVQQLGKDGFELRDLRCL